MIGVYLFALSLGGILLVASFFGDTDGPDHAGGGDWHSLFSLRNLTYVLFVFGFIGTALSWLGSGNPGIGTFLISLTAGLGIGAAVSRVFSYLHRTDNSEIASDAELRGRSAQVTLPVSSAGIGKIELMYGGQRVELLARPFGQDGDQAQEIRTGSEVVIVEMAGGLALVSPATTE
jgi:membrane protein implicated in regulation of membrane protease activity